MRPTLRPLALLPLLFTLGGCAAEPSPPPAAPAAPSPPAPVVEAPPAPRPALPAANDEYAGVEIHPLKVSGNVYMLQGKGGNIGALVGEDGIVIVDDEFAPLAPKIRAALKTISDKPIKFVVNTHWHGDHTGGNAAFGADAPIVAHENVRRRLMEGRASLEVAGKTIPATPPAPREALPIVTFDEDVTLHVDGEDLRAVHYPSGHTDGDAIIYFTKANVVHMGDDFVTYGFPVVDAGSGGSVRGMIAAIDKAVAQLPQDVKVIPGHGDISTLEDMKKLSAALKDIVHIVEVEVKKKRTLDQIIALRPLAAYEYLGKGFISADAFTEIVYKELTQKPAPQAPLPRPAPPPPPAKPAK